MKTAYEIAQKQTEIDMEHWIIEKKSYFINNFVDLGDLNDDNAINSHFGDILNNTGKGNEMDMCFNYALKNKRLGYVEEGVEHIKENYEEVKLKGIKRGDIVLFRDDCSYLHFARITKTSENIMDIFVRGKFGGCGIYEHKLGNTPTIYGNVISFWREVF